MNSGSKTVSPSTSSTRSELRMRLATRLLIASDLAVCCAYTTTATPMA